VVERGGGATGPRLNVVEEQQAPGLGPATPPPHNPTTGSLPHVATAPCQRSSSSSSSSSFLPPCLPWGPNRTPLRLHGAALLLHTDNTLGVHRGGDGLLEGRVPGSKESRGRGGAGGQGHRTGHEATEAGDGANRTLCACVCARGGKGSKRGTHTASRQRLVQLEHTWRGRRGSGRHGRASWSPAREGEGEGTNDGPCRVKATTTAAADSKYCARAGRGSSHQSTTTVARRHMCVCRDACTAATTTTTPHGKQEPGGGEGGAGRQSGSDLVDGLGSALAAVGQVGGHGLALLADAAQLHTLALALGTLDLHACATGAPRGRQWTTRFGLPTKNGHCPAPFAGAPMLRLGTQVQPMTQSWFARRKGTACVRGGLVVGGGGRGKGGPAQPPAIVHVGSDTPAAAPQATLKHRQGCARQR
jgi:hypothetical protein